MKYFFIFLLLDFWCFAFAHKYTLNPEKAEEILAQIVLRRPLEEKEWHQILKGREKETYRVVQGDTLWKISKKLFKNPFNWAKLWEVNDFLSNPHQLEMGQILSFYREEFDVKTIELVKLSPKDMNRELDAAYADLKVKNEYRPRFFVLTEKDKIYGKITGAYTEKEHLTVHDSVYIEIDPQQTVQIGDRLSLVRKERELRDKTKMDRPLLGLIVQLTGEAKIISVGDRLCRAEIVRTLGVIQRNDVAISPRKNVDFLKPLLPPDELEANIVMGDDPRITMLSQGSTVMINKGTNDGMEEGFLFRVYRDKDPKTQKTRTVEPEYKGEIQIISISDHSSIGYIMSAKDTIYPGELLLPAQLFEEPPPKKYNEMITLEIE